MKRELLALMASCLLLGLSKDVTAQTIFSENFNGANPLSNWTLIDVDGRTPAANVAYVTSAWVTREDFDTTGVGDEVAVSTSWYSPAGAADDYLISPAITLTTDNFLAFDAKAQDPAFPDGYELRISTTTPTVAGLMANPALFTIAAENPSWTRRTFDLSAYAGQTVYFGWRNNSNDQFLLLVDNVKVERVPANNASVGSLNISSLATNGSTVSIQGEIANRGSNAITKVRINWSDDGGTTVNTDSLTNVNIQPFTSANFVHATSWTAANPGTATNIMVWTSVPNDTVDGNPMDDSTTVSVFVNNGTPSTNKKVFLEEFTTAPCQFCPDGALVVEQIRAASSDVVAAGIHAGFGTDAMTISEHSTYANRFTSGAPTAMVDRWLFDGEAQVGHGRGTWASNTNTRLAANVPVDVSLTGTYNVANRNVNVDVDVDFVDFPEPGDLRVTLFIIEDSVVGSGSGYDQVNFYNTQAGHPYAGAGNPIVGYPHRHVMRQVIPSVWGDANFIGANPTPGSNYTNNYNFTLSNNYDADQVSMVAMVSYYDAFDDSKVYVLNVNEVKLTDIVTGIEEATAQLEALNIYPNPFNERVNVQFTLAQAEQVKVEMHDLLGQQVNIQEMGQLSAGTHRVTFESEALQSGFYFVRITVGDAIITKKVSLVK